MGLRGVYRECRLVGRSRLSRVWHNPAYLVNCLRKRVIQLIHQLEIWFRHSVDLFTFLWLLLKFPQDLSGILLLIRLFNTFILALMLRCLVVHAHPFCHLLPPLLSSESSVYFRPCRGCSWLLSEGCFLYDLLQRCLTVLFRFDLWLRQLRLWHDLRLRIRPCLPLWSLKLRYILVAGLELLNDCFIQRLFEAFRIFVDER